MILRQYQRDCANAVWLKWKEFQKLLAVLPTGTGKTIVFSKLAAHIADNAGGRVLILAHRDELIRQAQDKLRISTGLDSAVEKAGETAEGSLYPVTIGSVQTLCREKRRQKFPSNYYTHIIVDEAHHVLARSYLSILEHFAQAKVLGVTATPDRGDKKNLGTYFEELAYEYSIKQAINDQFLCQITAQTIPIKIDLSGVKTKAGDYSERDLDSAIDPYLGQIAESMREAAYGRKVLIFLPLIQTSLNMEEKLRAVGFTPCHIDGKSKDRRQILTDFHADRYDVLCNSMLLTEGFDEPSIDCICVLRPTQSRPLYAQMVGRGTRICEGKDDLLILDYLWHSERHALARPASLIAEDEEIEQRMVQKAAKGGPMELETLEAEAHSDVKQEREDVLKRFIDANAHRKARSVDPLVFGALLHDEEITQYESTFAWENQPATERQVATLQKFGFDGSNFKKGYASKVLDRVMKRVENNMASAKQINLLSRFGLRDFSTMTFDEASQKITRIKNNGWSRDFRKEKH